MITNDEVPVNVLTNYTAMGSEIQLFCGNQTNQETESASPVIRAVCDENGTWSPDLSRQKFATVQKDSEFNNQCIIVFPTTQWKFPNTCFFYTNV